MTRRSDTKEDNESAAPPPVPPRRTRDEEELSINSSEPRSVVSSDRKSTSPKDKISTTSKSVENHSGGDETLREETKIEKSQDDEREEKKVSLEDMKVKKFVDTGVPDTQHSGAAVVADDTENQPTPGAHASSDPIKPCKGLTLVHDTSASDSRSLKPDKGDGASDDSAVDVSDQTADGISQSKEEVDQGHELSSPTKVDAQAVRGIKEEPGEEEYPMMQSMASYPAGLDMTPIAAEVVVHQTDIAAQAQDIENRLRAELFKNSVSPRIIASGRGEDQDEQKRRTRCFIIAGVVLLLVVICAIVGGVLGTMAGGSSSPTIPAPPPGPSAPTGMPTIYVQPCTLCLDGSEPNLEAEVRRGYTCEDLENDLAVLDDPKDEVCLAGQADGWKSCSCPTLPSRPASFICSSACSVGSRPPAFDSQECRDFEAYVELVGLDASQCDSLITLTPEACRCNNDMVQLREILSVVSNGRDLFDTTSSQYKAMEWLANRDPANLTISSTAADVLQARYLGALLWESLGGASWVNQFGFLSSENVCNWNDGNSGVRCDDVTGDITHIIIATNNLIGTFPGAELTYFSGLQFIRLGGNDIIGTIPFSIGDLADLRELNMDDNSNFGGKLPSSLFQLRRLELLWLDNCDLSGTLPDNFGDATSLTSLSFLNTGLRGTIPTSIGKLTALQELFLGQNEFEGSLPTINNLMNMRRLFLHDNLFVGTIPAHYGQLQRLERLGLALNGLNGTIPDFSQNIGLQYLILYDNLLSGNIAMFFDTTAPNSLVYLDLDNNRFSGSISPAIENFRALDALFFQENQFVTGTLPTELGRLTGLSTVIDLQGTPFSGTIPTEFGRLTNLLEIDLSVTLLTGQIPSELGLMTSLTLLDVNGNRLNGTIPEEFQNLQSMERISFAANALNGTVPAGLATAPNLELLLVQDNALTGSLEAFCNAGVKTIRADCASPPEISCDCCETCL